MHLYFAILVAFLWAGTNIALKHIVGKFSPESSLCMTSILISLFAITFLILNPKNRQELAEKLNWRIGVFVAAVAFIGLFLPSFLYYRLLASNPVHLVMAIAYTSPAIVLLLMAIFGRDKLNWKSVVGVLMIVAGVVLALSAA